MLSPETRANLMRTTIIFGSNCDALININTKQEVLIEKTDFPGLAKVAKFCNDRTGL